MDNYIRVHRALRKERQEDVARAIGVTVGTINAIENGKCLIHPVTLLLNVTNLLAIFFL